MMIRSNALFAIMISIFFCADTSAMHRRPQQHKSYKKPPMHTPQPKKSWPSKQENARQKKLAAMHLERLNVQPGDEVMMVTGVVMLQQLARHNNPARR